MPPRRPIAVYFVTGYDRHTGAPRVVKTLWQNNHLVGFERDVTPPQGEYLLPLQLTQVEQLLRGEGEYKQAWNKLAVLV